MLEWRKKLIFNTKYVKKGLTFREARVIISMCTVSDCLPSVTRLQHNSNYVVDPTVSGLFFIAKE